jgi:hypothetical protein
MENRRKNRAENSGNNEKRGRDSTLSEATEPGAALPCGSKNPPTSSGGRQSHKSETRISAILDLARKSKKDKKSAAVIPAFSGRG